MLEQAQPILAQNTPLSRKDDLPTPNLNRVQTSLPLSKTTTSTPTPTVPTNTEKVRYNPFF